MTASITITPQLTTNAAGLFQTNSAGYTQGDVQDDPAVKFQLCSGPLSASATQAIWPGQPIQELIPVSTLAPGQGTLGNTLIQPTTHAQISGYTCGNQGYNGITSPQSNAPLFAQGQTVPYYRLGSLARIPLPILSSLSSLDGGQTNQQVSWDFTLNQITTYDGTHALALTILRIETTGNLAITYSAGQANWNTTGALALCRI